MVHTKQWIAIALLVGVVASVAGCDPVTPEIPDAAIWTTAAGDIELAACVAMQVSHIVVSVQPDGNSGPDIVIMDAVGSMPLNVGDEISSAGVPAGLTAKVWRSLPLKRGQHVSFLIDSKRESDPQISGDFIVPRDGLPESDWLRGDKSIGQDPCNS